MCERRAEQPIDRRIEEGQIHNTRVMAQRLLHRLMRRWYVKGGNKRVGRDARCIYEGCSAGIHQPASGIKAHKFSGKMRLLRNKPAMRTADGERKPKEIGNGQ